MVWCGAVQRAARGLRAWVWAMGALCAAGLLFVLAELALHGASGSGAGSEIFLSFLEGVLFFGN